MSSTPVESSGEVNTSVAVHSLNVPLIATEESTSKFTELDTGVTSNTGAWAWVTDGNAAQATRLTGTISFNHELVLNIELLLALLFPSVSGYFTNSISLGRQVLFNQGSRGPYMRRITNQLFPGTVCSQLFSLPAGAFGAK